MSYYKGQNLQSIIGFCTTVEYGSLTKAASVMHVSQAAVSKQISALEELLKTKLFKRVGNTKVLTEEGKEFYSIAINTINEFREINKRFFEKQKNKQNVIRISAHYYVLCDILPQVVKTIQDEDVIKDDIFEFSTHNIDDAIKMLLNNEIDCAIYPTQINSKIKDNYMLKYEKLFQYNPTLIMWTGHPLENVENSKITLDMILKNTTIIYHDTLSEEILQYILKSRYEKHHIITKANNLEFSINCVKHKLGITAMHKNYLLRNHLQKEFILKDIQHFFPETYFLILFNNNTFITDKIKKIITKIKETELFIT